MDRPNILFVYTDDQAPWALGAAGNRQAHTPNLDRFFNDGVRFSNSFVTTPVCSPSRAGLLVSRYGTEVGITDWLNAASNRLRNESELGLDANIVSWPRLLRDAGYATALVGKWHLGVADRYHPTRHGYDYFAGFRSGGMVVENPELEINGRKERAEGLTVDVISELAMDRLRHRDASKPFLLSVHYREPHAPWLPLSEADWAPYKDLNPEIPNPDYPDLDVERLKKMMREYLASTTAVDRNFGRLLACLDELGLRENTLVVFTSDNGYNMGHNGIIHKGNGHWVTKAISALPDSSEERARPNMYDNSIRVPTALQWPGTIRGGRTIDETIRQLDWYPTLLEATGVPLPKESGVRGRSLLPLLKGETVEWDNDLYGEFSQHHYTEADLRMYRTPEWKLVRDFRIEGRDELYHLAEDPAESRNRIGDADVADIRERLDAQLRTRMRELGDPLLK
jgi:choline-sulfatase